MKLKQLIHRSLVFASFFGTMLALRAVSPIIIYGNGATFGTDDVYKWSVDVTAGTSTLLRTYSNVGLQPTANGRGVVIVGNTMYTTDSGHQFEGDNHIYMTDVTTGASLGSFTTTIPGTVNLSTLAWDGTQFFSSQYIGGGNAYRFGLDGVVTKTVDLGGYDSKDGMEWFNGKLIANRGDAEAPYDIYDLDGNLLTSAFLDPGHTSTGIAFDGTDFFTVANFSSLDVWDGVTGAFIKNITLAGSHNQIEDLSVDYAQRSDTKGGSSVPDAASSLALLGGGMVALTCFRKRYVA